VSTIEELLGRNNRGSDLKKNENTAVGVRCTDHATPLYQQMLGLTSLTSGGSSVGIVRSRTKTTEFSFSYFFLDYKELPESSSVFILKNLEGRRLDNSVGTAYGYGLDNLRSIPAGARDFSLFQSVQTDSKVQPTSYSMGTSGSYLILVIFGSRLITVSRHSITGLLI
jgi:hypothetical protein